MKIYINNILVKAEILPSDTPTLDETLETFSFVLISNSDPLPYAPMQPVKVDFLGDGSDLGYFYIVSDSVDTFSLNPLRYKHTISCIQNTRELSKHIVRNSEFTQPANPTKESFNAIACYPKYIDSTNFNLYRYAPDSTALNGVSNALILEEREKIHKAYLFIGIQLMKTQYSVQTSEWVNDAKLDTDFSNSAQFTTWFDTLTLRYTLNGQTLTTTLTSQDLLGESKFLLFNTRFECPIIKQLADTGANNFELLFDSDVPIQGNLQDNQISSLRTVGYQMQIKIVAETYYYSCYDIIDILIKRQKKETSISFETPTFSLPSDPTNDLYILLNETVAPNFTFTQLTLYECVAEVFRVFDAIFTLDENNELGIEYFNDLSKEYINPTLVGKSLAHSEDKYTNGLIAYYQDGRVIKEFPGNNGFAPARSSSFGIGTTDDHYFIVSDPIHSIVSCLIQLQTGAMGKAADNTNIPIAVSGNLNLDITFNIVEKTVWDSLEAGVNVPNCNRLWQLNTLYFEQDGNKIALAETQKSTWNNGTYYNLWITIKSALSRSRGLTSLYGSENYAIPSPYNWDEVKMNLTYVTSTDGRIKIESLENKYNGETLVDQVNGAVDLNRLGINILGLSLKLGEPTLNATHRMLRWSDRIRVGQLYEYQGSLWIANVVNYTFFNNYIQGKVSFVKNFNQLSLRTQLLREKRMTNISRDLVLKSEENLIDFFYYGVDLTDFDFTNYSVDSIHINLDFVTSMINKTSTPLNYAILINKEIKDSSLNYLWLYLPMTVYGSGNSLCFEFSYDNALSCGDQTNNASNKWFMDTKYYTKPILYTDAYGFMDECDIYVRGDLSDHYLSREFPIINRSSQEAITFTPAIAIQNFKVYKQPNEIFALNYQLAFLPLKVNRDFISPELLNKNLLIDKNHVRELVVRTSKQKLSFLDGNLRDYEESASNVVVNATNQNGYIKVDISHHALTTYDDTIVAWALCDSEGKILFSSNTTPKQNKQTIYLFPRIHRLT